jgi:hypothetical protein
MLDGRRPLATWKELLTAKIQLIMPRCSWLTWLLSALSIVAGAKNKTIILSKTELTRRFAANGARRGITVDDLYLRLILIPHLIRVGQAKALPKNGKLERYAFRTEN